MSPEGVGGADSLRNSVRLPSCWLARMRRSADKTTVGAAWKTSPVLNPSVRRVTSASREVRRHDASGCGRKESVLNRLGWIGLAFGPGKDTATVYEELWRHLLGCPRGWRWRSRSPCLLGRIRVHSKPGPARNSPPAYRTQFCDGKPRHRTARRFRRVKIGFPRFRRAPGSRHPSGRGSRRRPYPAHFRGQLDYQLLDPRLCRPSRDSFRLSLLGRRSLRMRR